MKLIIAGSRDFDQDFLEAFFSDFTHTCWTVSEQLGFEKITEIIHGGCPNGVDAFAGNQWDSYWDVIPTTVFEADWDTHGKKAGPIRNRQMALHGDGLLLIWDGESRGSASMKREAENAGIPVFEVILKEPR